MGVHASFGVFVPAMIDKLGWRRASIGGAFSLYSMVYCGFSLVSRRMTDALVPQRVICIGGALLGLGIIFASQVTQPWHLYLTFGLVATLGMSAAYIPCTMTVVRWFELKRGLATGIASSGSSCGMLLTQGVCVAAFLIFFQSENAAWLYWGRQPSEFFRGIISLYPALVGDLFGQTHVGSIGGFIFSISGVLGAWGPALTGYLRKIHGDYRFAFIVCAMFDTTSFLLFASLPQPKSR